MQRLVLFAAFSFLCLNAQEPTRVFMQHCQQCHSPNSGAHAPLPEALSSVPWEDILKSLETGAMKAQGASLTVDERKAVARYLGKVSSTVAPPMGGQCAAGGKPTPGSAWNGWGVDAQNTRFQPAVSALINDSNVGKLKLKWAFGFPNGNTAFGQPTIVDGASMSAAMTAQSTHSTRAPAASTGCSRRRPWCGRPS